MMFQVNVSQFAGAQVVTDAVETDETKLVGLELEVSFQSGVMSRVCVQKHFINVSGNVCKNPEVEAVLKSLSQYSYHTGQVLYYKYKSRILIETSITDE